MSVRVEADDRVLWVTLDRPKQLNAIDQEVLSRLEAVVSEVETNQALRAVVITGTGKAFSVGMDLGCIRQGFADHAFFQSFLRRFHDLLLSWERLPIPTVAAVNGLARAGGFEIILACDMAIAAASARIADNHLDFGVIPGAGATQRAPRRLGSQRAAELIYSGRWLTAEEAADYGVILRVAGSGGLEAEVKALVDHFRSKSRDGLAAAKRAIQRGREQPIEVGASIEIQEFINYLATSPDPAEGFTASTEGRAPRWRT